MAGMARSAQLMKRVEFLVLVVLQHEPLHGYGIVKQISARTNSRVVPRPGDLYRVLYRLTQRGFLDVADRHAAGDLNDQRRTYYSITEQGRGALAAEAEFLSGIAAQVMEPVSRNAT
jgi:DNA-binding PadR family transcriptional regulator